METPETLREVFATILVICALIGVWFWIKKSNRRAEEKTEQKRKLREAEKTQTAARRPKMSKDDRGALWGIGLTLLGAHLADKKKPHAAKVVSDLGKVMLDGSMGSAAAKREEKDAGNWWKPEDWTHQSRATMMIANLPKTTGLTSTKFLISIKGSIQLLPFFLARATILLTKNI